VMQQADERPSACFRYSDSAIICLLLRVVHELDQLPAWAFHGQFMMSRSIVQSIGSNAEMICLQRVELITLRFLDIEFIVIHVELHEIKRRFCWLLCLYANTNSQRIMVLVDYLLLLMSRRGSWQSFRACIYLEPSACLVWR